MKAADMRQNYAKGVLLESDVNPNPFEQFALWFDEACKNEQIREANAMTLSTAVVDEGVAKVSSRILLLKNFSAKGFTFFTNYNSKKAQDLAANPYASLLFFWLPLERQIHIRGRVEKVSAQTSEVYFKSRPYGSQIGAWASNQSSVISGRDQLDQQEQQLKQQYPQEVPYPEHWGGYCLVPEYFEFWQGRPSRLHDRLAFSLSPEHSGWNMSRLSP